MNTETKIIKLFDKNPEWTVQEIYQELEVSKQMIHKVLKKLVENEVVQKYGTAPKSFYKKANEESVNKIIVESSDEEDAFLKNEFLLISETGQYLEGKEGFVNWCLKRNLPPEKTIKEFIKTKEKYAKFLNNIGLIDGTEKLKSTKGFETIYIDQLFYLDFYAIERFGKTKLGTILHYAKQGQNKFLMSILLKEIRERIQKYIAESGVDAVGFVPPTIRRETQIMTFLENGLNLNLPTITIKKMSGIIPIPQKSLNKLNERIINADTTFAVLGNNKYKAVLLIDDAVGSGATINQIAKKIKDKNITKKVIGLAVVGSYKGFEVITDI